MSISMAPNGVTELVCAFTGTPDGIADPATDWDVSGNTDTRTSISNEGVLKIGPAEAGTLTVTASWRNDDGTEGSQSVEVGISPAGVPYWPAQPGTQPTPTPPTPAQTVLTVNTSTGDPATSPLPKPAYYGVVLECEDGLPEDAAVALTCADEFVMLQREASGATWLVYRLTVGPGVADAAEITLTATGTGFDTVTKEFTVASSE